FFFSSRRRHTRLQGDWSSDVCSSDLDAGRDRNAPSADEILALADGRFGFRVVNPETAKREPVFDYEDVKEARAEEERAERLRLYYVAMTRAIDRLIVSGSIDLEREAERTTPIGWVLDRL